MRPYTPSRARKDLDRILDDMSSGRGPSGGATLPRQARRIRQAVDCLLLNADECGLPEKEAQAIRARQEENRLNGG